MWDALAVGTAFLAGWMLLYLTSLPDFAMLRDRAPDRIERKESFYGQDRAFSLASASEHQWRVLRRAEGSWSSAF